LCIARFDLFGEGAELVELGFGQVGGIRFFEEQEEVEDVIVGKIQLDDAGPSAFPPARQRHPGFAQAPASDDEVALLRIPEQFILERPEILVVNTVSELAGE
jgi:hypothetical protein